MQYSAKYIFTFSAALCLVCSMMVSVSAVGLRNRQEENKILDRQKSVLQASQIIKAGQKVSREEVVKLFEKIEPHVISIESGEYLDDIDAATFAPEDIEWVAAPANSAGIQEIPKEQQVFHVLDDNNKTKMLVLPIYGKGLWSTLRGYIALDKDGNTVRGITYYEHGETPGLGGEVDNPRWKNLWPGRKIYDDNGRVAIQVIKGSAGSPEADPHRVDGLSGATLTSRGVSNMLNFWMGENGYGPFISNFKAKYGSA